MIVECSKLNFQTKQSPNTVILSTHFAKVINNYEFNSDTKSAIATRERVSAGKS